MIVGIVQRTLLRDLNVHTETLRQLLRSVEDLLLLGFLGLLLCVRRSDLQIVSIGEILRYGIRFPAGIQNRVGSRFIDGVIVGDVPIQIMGLEPGIFRIGEHIKHNTLHDLQFALVQLQLIGGPVGGTVGTFVCDVPLLLRFFPKEEKVKTNANAMVGRRGTVCSAIEGVEGGRVVVDGVDWKARSVDGEDIAEGEKVEIVEIDSIVLIVKKL